MTDQLSAHWPQAESFANVASGLLAVSISQLHPSYIMWFRQEVVRTVRWGGDPRKDPRSDRLHPRNIMGFGFAASFVGMLAVALQLSPGSHVWSLCVGMVILAVPWCRRFMAARSARPRIT